MTTRMFSRFMTNITACEILEELRTMDKTKNYSGLLGSIEQLQVIYNRMESALELQKDFYAARDATKALRAKVEKLEKKKARLSRAIGKLEGK